jgi:hypothetical protein
MTIFPSEALALESICFRVAVSSRLPEMLSVNVSVRLMPPPVAEIVTAELPTVAPQFADRLSTEAMLPDGGMVEGLNVAETPAGNPTRDKVMGLLNPPVTAAEIAREPDELLLTLTEFKVDAISKLG